MYPLILIFCILAVILSPLVLDLFLSFKEARLERRAHLFARKNGSHLAWTSPRGR